MKRKRSVGLVGACLLEINCARRTWSRTTRAEVGSRERVGVSSPVGRGEGDRMRKGENGGGGESRRLPAQVWERGSWALDGQT